VESKTLLQGNLQVDTGVRAFQKSGYSAIIGYHITLKWNMSLFHTRPSGH